MKTLRGFLLGAVLVAAAGAYAAPSILAAIPLSSCTAITNVALSTSSEAVIAADTDRKSFCLVNGDASIAVHVSFHATATTADPKLGPGSSICESIEGGYIYTGAVDAIAASGTPAISGHSCK